MSTSEEQFNKDLKDLHLLYDYDAETPNGHEKWRYEMCAFSKVP